MYKNIMNLMNILEAEYRKDNSNYCIDANENDYGIILAINNFIYLKGGLIGFGGIMHNSDESYTPIIMVDNYYLNMSEEGKKFTVAHELGHLECHIEKFIMGDGTRDINNEFEADEYALKHLGLEISLKGLNEFKDIVMQNYKLNEDHPSIQEINLRIENLKNKVSVTY